MKNKKMSRNLYWLYNLILRNTREHSDFSLKRYIEMYRQYNLFVDRVAESRGVPWEISARIGTTQVRLPKYLEWIEKYLN